MSSLREVKDRIASVRSTLKITSAMKLVASSKLRKAQRAIEALRPYEQTLARILSSIPGDFPAPDSPQPEMTEAVVVAPTIILAFSSNTSMCGGFNANVIKAAMQTVSGADGPVEVWSFGRKMTDALRKSGRPAARDYSQLVAHPSSEAMADISRELKDMYDNGAAGSVLLVYNHFVSTGRQVPTVERFLPFEGIPGRARNDGGGGEIPGQARNDGRQDGGLDREDDYILEPSRAELAAALVPQVLDLKLYAALLDSAAAEHAARMVAMQAATDNAQDLLAELTLEYNKGRQQKITSEILDIVGGASE